MSPVHFNTSNGANYKYTMAYSIYSLPKALSSVTFTKKEPEVMETKTEEVEEEVETFECKACSASYEDEDTAADCCYACDECGETWSYESDAEHCCMPSCGECGEYYNDYEDAESCCTAGDEEGTMGSSDTAPWVNRGHDFSSIENKDDMAEAIRHWDIEHRPAPTTNAADFYLLEIVTNDLYQATGERVSFITPETVFNMKHMFDMDTIDLYRHVSDMNLSAFENLMFEASVESVRQVEHLDPIFLAYCQMAIGGELRHHRAVGGKVIDPPSRRAASWIAWKEAVEVVGPDIFIDAALLFREFTGGSYGGNKWAIPCEIVNMRLTEQLGPTPFMNRKLFIDRVWTLEHNGGCFLNKIEWPKGLNLQPLLDAHASNPEDIMFLYSQASKTVQNLFISYMEMVNELNPKSDHPEFDTELLFTEFSFCRYCYGNIEYGHHFGCDAVRTANKKKGKEIKARFRTVSGMELNNGMYSLDSINKIKNTKPHYDLEGFIINPVPLRSRIQVRFYDHDGYSYSFYDGQVFNSKSDTKSIEKAINKIKLDGINKSNFKDLYRIEIELSMERTDEAGYISYMDTFYVTTPINSDKVKTYGDIMKLTGKSVTV